MKRILAIITSLALLLSVVIIPAAFVVNAEETAPTYYVDEVNGLDTNDGLSEATALKTINKAQELIIAEDIAQDGTIIVIGTAEFNGGVPHTGMITIKGQTETATFTYVSEEIVAAATGKTVKAVVLKGPTTFDGIVCPTSAKTDSQYIVTGGQEAHFNLPETETAEKLILVGPVDGTPEGTREKVVFDNFGGKSGSYNGIVLGSIGNTNTTSAGVDITFNYGRLAVITLNKGTTYKGNVNIVINNFQRRNSTNSLGFTNNGPKIEGAFQVILPTAKLSHIKTEALTNMSSVVADGGTWILRREGDVATGTLLDTTEQAGVFTVSDKNMVATAYKVVDGVAETTATATSKKGILDLSAAPGVYDVTFATLEAKENTDTIVYVSENGADENNGTEEAPFGSIDFAQKWLNKSTAEGEKKIIVMGTVDFDGGEAHDEMITIQGYDENAALNRVTSKYRPAYSSNGNIDGVLLQGPTTFDNIFINGTIVNNGHKIVYQNLPSTKPSGTQTHIFGNTTGRQEIVFNDTMGEISTAHVLWFAANFTGKTMDGIDFEANNNATFNQFRLRNTTFTGDVNFVLNNFRATNDGVTSFSATGGCIFEGAFQLIANNGTYANFSDDAKTNMAAIEAANGTWVIDSEEVADGAVLKTTDVAGKFEVVSEAGLIAEAYNQSGEKVATSEDGILDLSGKEKAGVYTVKYVSLEEDQPFDFTGDGVINGEDLIEVAKALLGTNELENYDVNGDNVSDIRDFVALKNKIAGIA